MAAATWARCSETTRWHGRSLMRAHEGPSHLNRPLQELLPKTTQAGWQHKPAQIGFLNGLGSRRAATKSESVAQSTHIDRAKCSTTDAVRDELALRFS